MVVTTKSVGLLLICALLPVMNIPTGHFITVTQSPLEIQRQHMADDKMDRLLTCISTLESNNQPNLVILDVNGLYSYGQMQFQLPLLKEYFPEFPNTILKQIALDPRNSKLVANKVISQGKSYKWYNTMKKIKSGRCKLIKPSEV